MLRDLMIEGAIVGGQMLKDSGCSIPLKIVSDVAPSPSEMDESHHSPDGFTPP